MTVNANASVNSNNVNPTRRFRDARCRRRTGLGAVSMRLVQFFSVGEFEPAKTASWADKDILM
jgi:hypothetical protein